VEPYAEVYCSAIVTKVPGLPTGAFNEVHPEASVLLIVWVSVKLTQGLVPVPFGSIDGFVIPPVGVRLVNFRIMQIPLESFLGITKALLEPSINDDPSGLVPVRVERPVDMSPGVDEVRFVGDHGRRGEGEAHKGQHRYPDSHFLTPFAVVDSSLGGGRRMYWV
jgi:hypothetical protein